MPREALLSFAARTAGTMGRKGAVRVAIRSPRAAAVVCRSATNKMRPDPRPPPAPNHGVGISSPCTWTKNDRSATSSRRSTWDNHRCQSTCACCSTSVWSRYAVEADRLFCSPPRTRMNHVGYPRTADRARTGSGHHTPCTGCDRLSAFEASVSLAARLLRGLSDAQLDEMWSMEGAP